MFDDPYITTCGHTFCSSCVSDNEQQIQCPFDDNILKPVVRNIAVFEQVGELLVHCQYGCKPNPNQPGEYVVDTEGCTSVIKICEKQQHELECGYCTISCPNNTQCGSMLKNKLQDHLKTCEFIPCPHLKHGCHFHGNEELLKDHLKECRFEGVKGYLNRLDKMTNELQEEITKRDNKIELLSSAVANLKDRLEKQTSVSTLRIETLEEQQKQLIKDLNQANISINFFLSKLSHVEQQLGLNVLDSQHLFKCHGTFVGHKGPVWSLCTAGDLLFSSSSDYTIKVWNLSETYEGPKTLTGHDGIVLTVCAKDHLLYSGASDKTIKIWNIKKLELQTSFIAHNDPVCTLAISNARLFSGSLRSIKVWDLSDNRLLKTLPTQNHWVRALVATDRFLYSGSYRSVKIWSMDTLEVSHVLQCTGGSVYSLAVSNKHIICGTYENMIHVWDKESLSEVASLSGHVGTVYSLTLLPTPGHVRLFSASYDKTIRVWNMDLLTCAQTMSRHEGSVTCLTTCRGRIFSGAVDSTLKVWH